MSDDRSLTDRLLGREQAPDEGDGPGRTRTDGRDEIPTPRGHDEHLSRDRGDVPAPGGRAERMGSSSRNEDPDEPRLFPRDRADEHLRRWETLKAGFVDEPRAAVAEANSLVGTVLDEVEELFVRQRRELEADLRNDQASTEDLRLALGRYGTFFDRLLRI